MWAHEASALDTVECAIELTGSGVALTSGVSYVTHDGENFLQGTFKINKQDFIGKMEGFSIQGLSGMLLHLAASFTHNPNHPLDAASNYKQHISALHGETHSLILNGLSL